MFICLLHPSCNKMDEEEEFAHKAIIGTWRRTGFGTYLDVINEYPDGDSWLMELLPDGIYNSYYRSTENNGYYLYETNTFAISKDIITINTDVHPISRFTYKFFDNGEKLELVNADWTPINHTEDPIKIHYYYNIFYYQKKSNQTFKY